MSCPICRAKTLALLEEQRKLTEASRASTEVVFSKLVAYISYDRQDKNSANIAQNLASCLCASDKFDVYMDVQFGKYEENKYDAIIEGIKLTDVIFIVYNDRYQNNFDCQREATLAADQMKRFIFVRANSEPFRYEDWFFTLKGGRVEVDFQKEADPIEKIRWTAFEMFGLNIVRAPSGLEVRKFRPINIPVPTAYYNRPTYEQDILKELQIVCSNPEAGSLVIAGDGGVGKTTLLERILTDESNFDFFLDQCKIRAAVWLNCFEWRNPNDFGVKQQRAVLKAMIDKVNIRFASTITKFSRIDEFVAFVKDRGENPLFILDDVFNENLAQFVRQQYRNVPCCIITRDPVTLETQLYQPAPLVKKTVRISELADNEIGEMLQITYALDKNLSHEQIRTLAGRCFGLPLIASLLAGSIKDCKAEEYSQLLTSNVCTLNAGSPYGSVVELFQFSLNLLIPKLCQAYYAFLLFDPGDPISVVDLAILWEHDTRDRTYTERQCQLLADKSLLRKGSQKLTPGEDCWYIHQMLHEAATKHAAECYKLEEQGALSKIRLRILTGRLNSKKTSQADLSSSNGSIKRLCEAVKQRRLLLLSKIIENLDPPDLAELCRQKSPEIDGMTFLHYIYTVNWAINENTYFGTNISYRLIREIIFKLREFKIDFLALVNENRDLTNQRAAGKPKNLREHLFSEKESWRYTPDRNSLIEILGLSMQKLNDEKKWEESFCSNETYRNFLIAINERDSVTAFDNFMKSYEGKSLNKHDQGELTMCAARKGNYEVVVKLIEMYPNTVRHRNRTGLTAAMFAAANNHLKVVQFLCERYIDASAQDSTGWTALMHATFNGHLDVVDYLYPRTMGVACEKPLMIAASNGFLDIVEYLTDKHPETGSFQDPKSGLTPLMCAARCGYQPIVEYLHLVSPTTISLVDKDNWTAFMFAASGGHIETLDYLYHAYCDAIKIADKNGLTPLMCAARYGHLEVVCYLYDRDPTANTAKDKDGRTALMHAAASGQMAVVCELKEREANSSGSQTQRSIKSITASLKQSLSDLKSNTNNTVVGSKVSQQIVARPKHRSETLLRSSIDLIN